MIEERRAMGEEQVDYDPTDLVSLKDATQWFPKRNGKAIAFQTVYRWALHGIKGVRLRTVQVGCARCTSKAWVKEFIDAVTARVTRDQVEPVATRRGKPSKRSESASRRLDELGIGVAARKRSKPME